MEKKQTFKKRELIRQGWELFKEHAGILIAITLFMGITNSAVTLIGTQLGINTGIQQFISSLISVFLNIGYIAVLLNIIRKKEVSFGQLFTSQNLRIFFVYIGVMILSTIFIFGGMILLIIPGIIIALGLSFAQWVAVDQKLGVWKSITESWKMTKGHRSNLFLLGILLMLINIAGLLALVIGLIVTAPLTMVVLALVYEYLRKNYTATASPEAAPAMEAEVKAEETPIASTEPVLE